MPPKGTQAKNAGNKGKGGAPGGPVPPVFSAKASEQVTDEACLPALAALPNLSSSRPRRNEYIQKFNRLAEIVLSSDATYRLGVRSRQSQQGIAGTSEGGSPSGPADTPLGDDYFPTLRVAFIARAMGLNLTELQIVHLVQLVEDDAASRGSVSRSRLEAAVVDALMTGMLGGPTLEQAAPFRTTGLPPEWRSSSCLRPDEEAIFKAFSTIDTAGRGYLSISELRLAMTTMGDPLTAEEMDEMVVAMSDSDSDVVYYRDFADILARD